jgi:phage tail-like protein
MAAQGEAREYDEQSMFVLEIDNIEVAFFETCSEFEDESGLTEQREGGNKAVASKTNGIETLTPITLSRGATKDMALYDWRQEVKTQGSRAAERNASIVQLNPDGSPKSRINLKRAWPGKYKRGPWDAKSDDTVKEEIVLHYHEGEFKVE